MTGSVNFRTGQVRGRSNSNTTLYDVFKAYYTARGLSEAEINWKLGEIFTLNENNEHVFRDYTSHDMRIFYMERGAGASNLRMRFNLAAVRPNTFVLSKKLTGTDQADNDLIEFPYQVFYTSKEDGGTAVHQVTDPDHVHYNGTSVPVTHRKPSCPQAGPAATAMSSCSSPASPPR